MDDKIYTEVTVTIELSAALNEFQENNNSRINEMTQNLSKVSRLICDYRDYFEFDNKKILSLLDSINHVIGDIERLKKDISY